MRILTQILNNELIENKEKNSGNQKLTFFFSHLFAAQQAQGFMYYRNLYMYIRYKIDYYRNGTLIIAQVHLKKLFFWGETYEI